MAKRKRLAQTERREKKHRKDVSHKVSRKLVEESKRIVLSKDNSKRMAKVYGRVVTEASHYPLCQMLSYKRTASGREYVEVDCKGPTMICSNGLAKTGRAALSVRQWECTECGILHERNHNAAILTLLAGLAVGLKRCA